MAGHAWAAWLAHRDGIQSPKIEKLLRSEIGSLRELGNGLLEMQQKLEAMAPSRLVKMQKCFKIVMQQDLRDQRMFFDGFNAALKKGTITKNGELVGIGSATLIYFALAMTGDKRLRENIGSVHELHRRLVKMFGSNAIGDLKRVEKMCQRIGLHFRKPGRPKKA